MYWYILQIKWDHKEISPAGLGHEKNFVDEAQEQLQTRDPTSRNRGCRTSTNPQISKDYEKKKLVAGPRWVPDTGRLTVGRNITLTLASTLRLALCDVAVQNLLYFFSIRYYCLSHS
jgi:hypothetical protein